MHAGVCIRPKPALAGEFPTRRVNLLRARLQLRIELGSMAADGPYTGLSDASVPGYRTATPRLVRSSRAIRFFAVEAGGCSEHGWSVMHFTWSSSQSDLMFRRRINPFLNSGPWTSCTNRIFEQ